MIRSACYLRPAIRLDGAPLGGRLFRKEVLRAGTWTHPATGQDHTFSPADLSKIASETNRLIASGVKVPFPDGTHNVTGPGSASNNLGFWLGLSAEGDQLFGVCEASDAEVAKALGTKMRDVSIYLEPEVLDSHGKKYAPAVTHICATQYPVIEGQDNFVQLSRNGSEATVPVLRFASKEKKTMALNAHLVAIAAALALSTDGIADDAALEAKIKDHATKTTAEKEAALAASRTGAAALSAKESETAALASRLKAVEDDRKAESEAMRDGEVRATAEACKGKPEAFSAERQARVKALWPKDREAAREIMALARESAGVTAKLPEGTQPAKQPDATVTAAQLAKDKLDTEIAAARARGFSISHEGGVAFAKKGKQTIRIG